MLRHSGIAALATIAAVAVGEGVFERAFDRRKWTRIAIALAPGLGLVAGVGAWQTADPVYAAASGNVIGGQTAAPFWYPLTYGALALLALRGARIWAASDDPHRFALLSWTAAMALLHSSPILNGYHFVSQLHIPVCIAAAPAFAVTLDRLRSGAGRARAGAALLVALLFANPILVTIESIDDVRELNTIPRAYRGIVNSMEGLPPGNVLTSPWLGNVLPAYTPHRVFVGHHFLTPDYRERSGLQAALVSDPARADELRALIDEQRIRYVVVRDKHLATVRAALAPRIARALRHGRLVLLILGG